MASNEIKNLLKIESKNPDQSIIENAVAVIQRGGVIAFPTDTGYALGCDLYFKKSINRICRMKGRDPNSPLSFICSDLTSLSQYAVVGNNAYQAMRKLLPGPYTFVLPATRLVPKLLVSSRSTVGIRIPDHNITQALVNSLRHPIIGASCSNSEGVAFESPSDIVNCFGKQIDLILSAGKVSSDPSSVIDFTSSEPRVIREGKGDLSALNIKK